ncbi:MAG: DUF6471 domain-containing protein [Alphaproteobacteria bacterium]
MRREHGWDERARRFIKAELKRQGVTYEELAKRLAGEGMEETKGSIAAKISRGAFPATFLLASLKAIGTKNVRVEDI